MQRAWKTEKNQKKRHVLRDKIKDERNRLYGSHLKIQMERNLPQLQIMEADGGELQNERRRK